MNDIRERVRTMILTSFLEGDDSAELSDTMSLERSHVVDSVRALELILFVEETFGIEVANEEAVPQNFDNVDAIVSYVQRKRGGQ